MGKLILISGKNNSGKSVFAESIVAKCTGRRYYVATMIPKTEENRKRIEKHRIQRANLGFDTVEIPYDLSELKPEKDSVVLLEDVSNLLANNIFDKCKYADDVFNGIVNLLERCEILIAVTIADINVCGYDGETAAYIENINEINQRLHNAASVAVSMTSGNAVYEKGKIDDIF